MRWSVRALVRVFNLRLQFFVQLSPAGKPCVDVATSFSSQSRRKWEGP